VVPQLATASLAASSVVFSLRRQQHPCIQRAFVVEPCEVMTTEY
jgi:hypothetical protein